MKRIFALVIIIYLSSNIYCQNDKAAIKSVINIYFDGWSTSDTLLLSKIMHQSCQLKFLRDNEFSMVSKQVYLSRFGPRKEKDMTIKTKIKSIDITGNAASAKITIDTENRFFTDYFNLLKINNEWKIVDKITFSKMKEKRK